jgi:hypothetical protein
VGAGEEQPYWSVEAYGIYQENYRAGKRTKRELCKGLQHDHVMPKLFFEELLMSLVRINRQIPLEDLTLLFDNFGFGAMVSAHENQKKLDGFQEVIKGRTVWRKKPRMVYGMSGTFFEEHHEHFLNPWARYMDTGLKVLHNHGKELDYEEFRFNKEAKGFELWKTFLPINKGGTEPFLLFLKDSKILI